MNHTLLITLPTQLEVASLTNKTDLVNFDSLDRKGGEKLVRMVINSEKCTLFPILKHEKVSLILGDILIDFSPEEPSITKNPDRHFKCAPSWFSQIKIQIT